MRILMVTPMPPSTKAPGAIPQVLAARLDALRQRHAVTVLTVAGPEPHALQAVEALERSGLDVRAVRRLEPRGLDRWKRRVRLASGWLRGYPWRTVWFYERDLQTLIDAALTRESFDLITVDDNALGRYRYSTSRPVVYFEHEVRLPRPFDRSGWRRTGLRAWAFHELDWMRWRRYQTATWRSFTRLFTFTQRDAEHLRSLAPDLASRVRTVPFGCAVPPAADPVCEEDGVLLFIGNYSHWPNVDAALWLGQVLMPALRPRRRGVRLTLVGAEMPPSVRALAADDIELHESVPDIDGLLGRAAIVLAPVRVGGGMRLKVLQSLAYGKAVVTTARGAEGLAVADEPPPVCLAESVDDYLTHIINLLDHPEQRRALGARARQHMLDHFTPDVTVRALERAWQDLVPEGARR